LLVAKHPRRQGSSRHASALGVTAAAAAAYAAVAALLQ